MYLVKTNKPSPAKEFVDKAIEQDKTNREASELLASFTKPKSKVQKGTNNPQKSIMFQNPKSKTTTRVNPLQTK